MYVCDISAEAMIITNQHSHCMYIYTRDSAILCFLFSKDSVKILLKNPPRRTSGAMSFSIIPIETSRETGRTWFRPRLVNLYYGVQWEIHFSPQAHQGFIWKCYGMGHARVETTSCSCLVLPGGKWTNSHLPVLRIAEITISSTLPFVFLLCFLNSQLLIVSLRTKIELTVLCSQSHLQAVVVWVGGILPLSGFYSPGQIVDMMAFLLLTRGSCCSMPTTLPGGICPTASQKWRHVSWGQF